ncbi:MAG: endonuclease MutS2, partial [Planctomycetota bacterium]|nr:endonuclease MutS2 [Planctomycetota bacterium]
MAPFEHAIHILEYGRIREILSAYAESVLGRKLASQLRPCPDGEELRRVHAETRELGELLESARLPLAGLSDVCSGLKDNDSGGQPLEPEHLYRIVDLLRSGLGIREAFCRDEGRFPALSELGEELDDLPELRQEIPEIIDLHEGVRSEASEKLSSLRRELSSLKEKLRQGATAMLKRPDLKKCFQSEGVTLKNDRYLLPVKAEYRSWMKGPVRDRSQSGSTLYIEPEQIVQDGDRLLSLLDRERDEVLRILWELTRKVRDERVTLRRLQGVLAKVDLTAAKAAYAAAFGLISPEIGDGEILDLRDARHPYLMWLSRDTTRDFRDLDLGPILGKVVPLDLRLGDPAGILVVTGPNTGGKTVALKTVGLNVLLALSGVPVAASKASIPVYNDLFVDIGDEQSLEQNLSTFSGHLKQLVEILRGATGRSLILLDELGSGTDPLEGAALGTAILDYFRAKGWKAIITTHLGSMKKYGFLHDDVENAAMEFDNRSLKPTYRLLMGVPGNSNALAIARRLGVSEEVLSVAEEEIARIEEPT